MSFQSRILALKQYSETARAGDRWTEDEDIQLMKRRINDHTSLEDIAKEHQRTIVAIKTRIMLNSLHIMNEHNVSLLEVSKMVKIPLQDLEKYQQKKQCTTKKPSLRDDQKNKQEMSQMIAELAEKLAEKIVKKLEDKRSEVDVIEKVTEPDHLSECRVSLENTVTEPNREWKPHEHPNPLMRSVICPACGQGWTRFAFRNHLLKCRVNLEKTEKWIKEMTEKATELRQEWKPEHPNPLMRSVICPACGQGWLRYALRNHLLKCPVKLENTEKWIKEMTEKATDSH